MTLEVASKRHTHDPAARSGPPGREPLSPEIVELTALRLRVIADPTRIVLLEALSEGEGAVCELADRTGLSHQITSHHLLVLHQAGILTRQREGKLARYGMADWSAWWVVEQIARSAEPSVAGTA